MNILGISEGGLVDARTKRAESEGFQIYWESVTKVNIVQR
jgi:hypothetical protein